jgi:hypothetical protein
VLPRKSNTPASRLRTERLARAARTNAATSKHQKFQNRRARMVRAMSHDNIEVERRTWRPGLSCVRDDCPSARTVLLPQGEAETSRKLALPRRRRDVRFASTPTGTGGAVGAPLA